MTGGPQSTVEPPSRVGEVLDGKYELLRKLGQGGMGAVYEAKHTFVGRRFAVKFLHAELAHSEDIMARFRREAQTAGALECENIAAVTDFGLAADRSPYLVMEMLQGEDLRALITREGQLPVPRILSATIQACRALEAAHAQGIIHRDLKPENVFVTQHSDGSDLVKVLDFGIAKLRSGSSSGVSTQAGSMIGTLAYMPPEQVRGEKSIDHRADIYALGAMLYECLSGHLPHPGNEPHVVMYHILQEQPAPLESLRSGLPEGLAAVIHKALNADPAYRHQAVRELSNDLSAFVRQSALPAAPVSADTIAAMETQTTPASLAPGAVAAAATPIHTPGPAAPGSAPGSGETPPSFDRKSVGQETQQVLVASGLTPARSKGTALFGIAAAVLLVAIVSLVIWSPWATPTDPSAPASEPSAATPATEDETQASDIDVAPIPPSAQLSADASGPEDERPSPQSNTPDPPVPAAAARKSGATPDAPAVAKPNADPQPKPAAQPTDSTVSRAARGRKRKVDFERTNPFE